MSKLGNWITLLALTMIFVIGGTGLLLAGAVVAQAYAYLGGAMMLCGFGAYAAGFTSVRLMEKYV